MVLKAMGSLLRNSPWYVINPLDNFGTVVGENPTPYGILALWAVNSLSIVYWEDYLIRLLPF